MKVSTLLAAGALAGSVVAEEESVKIVTVTFTGSTDTHVWGRFDKTSASESSSETGTHVWGKFDKTSASESSSETGTHVWGRFDKTSASESSSETGTHVWGKFDKTSASESSSETGTHVWGRFDKTSASESSSETGTHVWGKFDNTQEPLTTTVYVLDTAVSNSLNLTTTTANGAAGAQFGAVSAGLAGAFALGLVLL